MGIVILIRFVYDDFLAKNMYACIHTKLTNQNRIPSSKKLNKIWTISFKSKQALCFDCKCSFHRQALTNAASAQRFIPIFY